MVRLSGAGFSLAVTATLTLGHFSVSFIPKAAASLGFVTYGWPLPGPVHLRFPIENH